MQAIAALTILNNSGKYGAAITYAVTGYTNLTTAIALISDGKVIVGKFCSGIDVIAIAANDVDMQGTSGKISRVRINNVGGAKQVVFAVVFYHGDIGGDIFNQRGIAKGKVAGRAH